jgi:hypothetical protein
VASKCPDTHLPSQRLQKVRFQPAREHLSKAEKETCTFQVSGSQESSSLSPHSIHTLLLSSRVFYPQFQQTLELEQGTRYTCNPSYLGGSDQEDGASKPGWAKKKVFKTSSQQKDNKTGRGGIPVIPATAGNLKQEDCSPDKPMQKARS